MHLLALDQYPYSSHEKAGSDVLVEATYHDGGATCERYSKDHVLRRTARRYDEKVTIHYGTIKFGNQVIKERATRDRLGEELGGFL